MQIKIRSYDDYASYDDTTYFLALIFLSHHKEKDSKYFYEFKGVLGGGGRWSMKASSTDDVN
jgi:hypothetical protein